MSVKTAATPGSETPKTAIRGYYDRANSDLLNRIPLTAQKVLELGCGAGALGAALKKRLPSVFYVGLELDPDAASIAQERLDEVAVFNADTDTIPTEITDHGPYDVVVFGDVLEHLRDPWTVMSNFVELLAPGGTLLACIPNVQNWKFLQTVLTEGFRYDQEGLFDRTHLRWFALPNMIDMLRQAGVTPMAATPRHVLTQTQNGDSHAKFVSAMTPSLAGLGIDPEDFHRRTMPLQYVLRGTKDPLPKRRMLVQAMMLKPVGGVNDVRIGRPLSALRSMTGVETVASVRNFSFMERAPDVAKIMIWQRPVHQKHEAEKILKLMERGYVVVTEFDDHLMRWPAIEANDYLTIKGCHGVQTSTDYLAAIFREQMADQQRPIAVFPNSLLDLPEPQNFDNPKTLRVFFGALNREEDWAPIMPGLNQAIASLTDKAQLFFDVIHDRAFFEALETEHKVFTETCPYATYLDQLSQADIALLPLADTLFNRCKSDLKFIEAGGCGCAVLASDTLYNLTVKDGETGHLITKPEDFGTRLLAMVDDPEGAKSMGDAARAYVRSERMMASQVEARLDWYQELWDTRHETTPAIIDYLKSVIES